MTLRTLKSSQISFLKSPKILNLNLPSWPFFSFSLPKRPPPALHLHCCSVEKALHGKSLFGGLSSLVCEKFFGWEARRAVCVSVVRVCTSEAHNESHKNLSKAQKCTRRAIKIIFFLLRRLHGRPLPSAKREKLPSASGKLKIRRRKGARVVDGNFPRLLLLRFFWRLSGKCFSPSILPLSRLLRRSLHAIKLVFLLVRTASSLFYPRRAPKAFLDMAWEIVFSPLRPSDDDSSLFCAFASSVIAQLHQP